VYLATWSETPVAVKILLNPQVDVASTTAAQAVALSTPVLAALEKASAACCRKKTS
jgi:hypothetical protein